MDYISVSLAPGSEFDVFRFATIAACGVFLFRRALPTDDSDRGCLIDCLEEDLANRIPVATYKQQPKIESATTSITTPDLTRIVYWKQQQPIVPVMSWNHDRSRTFTASFNAV